MSLLAGVAGVLTLTVLAVPVTAQTCNGGNKDKNTTESNFPDTTQSSTTVEATAFTS
ncbi:hypothetical protein [Hyella patelloides]|nr:hypothetical protein [Hyella patelloides]